MSQERDWWSKQLDEAKAQDTELRREIQMLLSEVATLEAALAAVIKERDEFKQSLRALAAVLVDTNTKTSVESVAALAALAALG